METKVVEKGWEMSGIKKVYGNLQKNAAEAEEMEKAGELFFKGTRRTQETGVAPGLKMKDLGGLSIVGSEEAELELDQGGEWEDIEANAKEAAETEAADAEGADFELPAEPAIKVLKRGAQKALALPDSDDEVIPLSNRKRAAPKTAAKKRAAPKTASKKAAK